MSNAKFQLICDSTCDIPKNWYKENDVKLVPFAFVMDDKEYWDEVDTTFNSADVYKSIREGKTPTTLQGRMEDLLKTFEQACMDGLDVVYICFSSGLSGTYNTSRIAAGDVMQKYPDRKIYCIDTLAATSGVRLLIELAADLRDSGGTAEQIAEHIEQQKLKVCHFFTVDDLNHLYRGGRLSKTSALMGTMLGIKPLMYVDNDGKLAAFSKVRGRAASIKELAKKAFEHLDKDFNTIYIAHGDCEDEAKQLEQEFLKLCPEAQVIIHMLTPVIGVHSGPGTLGIFVMGEKRL